MSEQTVEAFRRRRTASTFLLPADALPDLDVLSLRELQCLHSRICRQLDREYLSDPDGPSVVTLDRQQELVEELDERERAAELRTSQPERAS